MKPTSRIRTDSSNSSWSNNSSSRTSNNYWPNMVSQYERRNANLECRQVQLSHRLRALECALPNVLVNAMVSMHRGTEPPKIDLESILEASDVSTCPCPPCRSPGCSNYPSKSPETQLVYEKSRNNDLGSRDAREGTLPKNGLESGLMENDVIRDCRPCGKDKSAGPMACPKACVQDPPACERVPSVDSNSLCIASSSDLNALKRIQELVEQERTLKKYVADLEKREMSFVSALRRANELLSDPLESLENSRNCSGADAREPLSKDPLMLKLQKLEFCNTRMLHGMKELVEDKTVLTRQTEFLKSQLWNTRQKLDAVQKEVLGEDTKNRVTWEPSSVSLEEKCSCSLMINKDGEMEKFDPNTLNSLVGQFEDILKQAQDYGLCNLIGPIKETALKLKQLSKAKEDESDCGCSHKPVSNDSRKLDRSSKCNCVDWSIGTLSPEGEWICKDCGETCLSDLDNLEETEKKNKGEIEEDRITQKKSALYYERNADVISCEYGCDTFNEVSKADGSKKYFENLKHSCENNSDFVIEEKRSLLERKVKAFSNNNEAIVEKDSICDCNEKETPKTKLSRISLEDSRDHSCNLSSYASRETIGKDGKLVNCCDVRLSEVGSTSTKSMKSATGSDRSREKCFNTFETHDTKGCGGKKVQNDNIVFLKDGDAWTVESKSSSRGMLITKSQNKKLSSDLMCEEPQKSSDGIKVSKTYCGKQESCKVNSRCASRSTKTMKYSGGRALRSANSKNASSKLASSNSKKDCPCCECEGSTPCDDCLREKRTKSEILEDEKSRVLKNSTTSCDLSNLCEKCRSVDSERKHYPINLQKIACQQCREYDFQESTSRVESKETSEIRNNVNCLCSVAETKGFCPCGCGYLEESVNEDCPCGCGQLKEVPNDDIEGPLIAESILNPCGCEDQKGSSDCGLCACVTSVQRLTYAEGQADEKQQCSGMEESAREEEIKLLTERLKEDIFSVSRKNEVLQQLMASCCCVNDKMQEAFKRECHNSYNPAPIRPTYSGLLTAIEVLRAKCRNKDGMIATLADELRGSKNIERVVDNITGLSHDKTPWDFDQCTLYNYLKEPNYSKGSTVQFVEESITTKTANVEEVRLVVSNSNIVVPKPINFEVVKRIYSCLLVSWETPENVKDVSGYEIFVDGCVAARIRSGGRTKALLRSLDTSKTLTLMLYAIGPRGRFSDPLTITYAPCSCIED